VHSKTCSENENDFEVLNPKRVQIMEHAVHNDVRQRTGSLFEFQNSLMNIILNRNVVISVGFEWSVDMHSTLVTHFSSAAAAAPLPRLRRMASLRSRPAIALRPAHLEG
jgi:hypothetical protein